jgi:hypothetical protein
LNNFLVICPDRQGNQIIREREKYQGAENEDGCVPDGQPETESLPDLPKLS